MFPPERRGGRVECTPGSGGGIPITPRNGASATVTPRSSVAVSPSSVHRNGSSCANVMPQERGVTSSIRDDERLSGERAAHLDRAGERVTVVQRGVSLEVLLRFVPAPARVQRLEAHAVARIDGQHRRERRREVAVHGVLLQRDLVDHARGSWIHASGGAISTRSPTRRPSSSRNSQSETACSSPFTFGAIPAGR